MNASGFQNRLITKELKPGNKKKCRQKQLKK